MNGIKITPHPVLPSSPQAPAEKAGISFDLLLEIRRRLVEACQEIIRMPI